MLTILFVKYSSFPVLYVWLHNIHCYCCVSILLLMDRCLNDLAFWIIMNSAAMNISEHIPWSTYVCVSIVHKSRSGIAGSQQLCVCYVLVYTAKQFSKMTVSIYSTLSTA